MLRDREYPSTLSVHIVARSTPRLPAHIPSPLQNFVQLAERHRFRVVADSGQ